MGEQLIVIGKRPDIAEPLEMVAWGKINEFFKASYYANRAELIAVCEWHSHAMTAESFVDYCLKNDWLREVTLETRGESA
jgi:hypothetical protein